MRSKDIQRNTCGCCQEPVPATPEEIKNRPGLSTTSYRVGTYASFRQAMIDAIASKFEVDGNKVPLLRVCTARSSDDYGIALIEMWAYLADILTFYQERIANEAFLRTAQFPESVLQLAALLDYKPAPGMAATAYLAFAAEKGKQVMVPEGLRVQSVPGQNEKPQKFETVEAITVNARLNNVRIFPEPKPYNPFQIGSKKGNLDPRYAASIAKRLSSGDQFVVFSADGKGSIEDKEIESINEGEITELAWKQEIQQDSRTIGNSHAFKFVRKFRLFGYNAPKEYLRPEVSGRQIIWENIEEDKNTKYRQEFILGDDISEIELDAIYDDIKKGTQILIHIPPCEITLEKANGTTIEINQKQKVILTTVTNTSQVAKNKGPLNATVTKITLKDKIQDKFYLRGVDVYKIEGDEILFCNSLSYPEDIPAGTNIVYVPLSQVDSVESKRTLILDDNQLEPQIVTVTNASPMDMDGDKKPDHLMITFTPPLKRKLNTKTATLQGNVALATHGETVKNEVLGSGDASVSFQSFSVAKSPVTFVPDPEAPRGAANTLKLRVDGVEWREERNFFGHGPRERIHTTSIDADGKMTVQFGDGINGVRLPTGRNNIAASYRQGLGREGDVKAKSLTTLLDRPVGLKSVTNPADAEGSVDPESLKDAKRNAPNTVRTFDRIVSLRDFEDAARERGVAKARASWAWNGDEQTVHLTVAGDGSKKIDDSVKKDLIKYLNARRDLNRRLEVEPHEERKVRIEAEIKVNSDYEDEKVKKAAKEALIDRFAFENQDLGQAVHLSDVYGVLQRVEGVEAARVTQLEFKNSLSGQKIWFRGMWIYISIGKFLQKVVQDHLFVTTREIAFVDRSGLDVAVNIWKEHP